MSLDITEVTIAGKNLSQASTPSLAETLFNKTISGATNTLSNIAQSSVVNLTSDLASKENISNKGQPNGYASLDAAGRVPATQLPSYVDDILEFANLAAFPAIGETGKIYIAIDTSFTYRWTGSTYLRIGLGTTNLSISRNSTSVIVNSDTGLSGTILPADSINAGIMSSADKTKLDGIETGATVNSTDAQLRDRSTHTGTQAQSTITNLIADLNNKVNSNIAITGATNTKITYDSKGLVTGGTSLIENDIPNLSQNKINNLTSDLASKENISNKSTATSLGTSDTLYPTQNAVRTYVDAGLGAKQNTLVSGTNIRTIQGASILGSNDLKVATGNANEVQFVDASGNLAGASNVEINNGNLQLTAVVSDPTPPITNNLLIYSKSLAGRMIPHWLGPSNLVTPFQGSLSFNAFSGIFPNQTTTFSTIGCSVTTTGTLTNPTPAAGFKAGMRRVNLSSGGTAGAIASVRANILECYRGAGIGQGGFFAVFRFSLTNLQTGMRAFIGLADVVTAPTNINPLTNTTPGKIGMAIANNTGNWFIITNITGTVPTTIDLGANFAVNITNVYDLILFCASGGTSITYQVINLNTGNSTTGSFSSNIIANTTFLTRQAWVTNNTTAAAATMDIMKITLETDY